MGTHPSKPSHLLKDGKSLADVLHADASLIGPAVREKFGDDLPFLFKVLAVGKALSIQAHPDKKLGAKLHKERPDVYKGARAASASRTDRRRPQSQGAEPT